MTKDEVIRLAREACATPYKNRHFPDRPFHVFSPEQLERFAALVIKEHTQQVKETPVHKIDGADWPAPDSGFAKLEAL